MGSKMKTNHVNMLKKYISREPEGNVVPVDSTNGATVAVAGVIHQDVNPELGEMPDLERYVFTDMPGKTDVIQHQIKLTDDMPIRYKPYPLPYAIREELRNEVDTMPEMGVLRR